MKKIIVLLLAGILLFSLASCGEKNPYVLISGEGTVNKGVYAYFLDKVMSSPEAYSVDLKSKEAVRNAAEALCKEYMAAEKLLSAEKISFSQQYKSQVAEETEKEWSLFGNYYKSIGMTKPDLTLINTYEAQKDCLLQYYYGKGGKNEVSDIDLKEKFVDLYIGFKAFEGSFTKVNVKGETVDMTESEREALIAEFRSMANKINEGASIDEVYADYCKKEGLVATNALEVMLTTEKDPMYADDFFKKLSTITHGKAAPVTSGSSVYVVERCTIASSDEDVFEQYRAVVLEKMKMSSVEKKITKKADGIKPETNEKLASKVYEAVAKVHTKEDK